MCTQVMIKLSQVQPVYKLKKEKRFKLSKSHKQLQVHTHVANLLIGIIGAGT